jgi:hypothetical protein
MLLCMLTLIFDVVIFMNYVLSRVSHVSLHKPDITLYCTVCKHTQRFSLCKITQYNGEQIYIQCMYTVLRATRKLTNSGRAPQWVVVSREIKHALHGVFTI